MKTKRFKWIAALLLLVAAMVMPTTAWAETITPEQPNDGNGDSNNPFGIQSVEHLYWFASYVNGSIDGTTHLSACATLDQDITINSKVLNEDGTFAVDVSSFIPWTPIGSFSNGAYYGTFDGGGYTIRGLYFNDTTKENVGLFGYSHGTIKNVGVVDSYFNGYGYVGGVCGNNAGTIENCYNSGKVEGINNFVGGVCGYGFVTNNCHNTGSVNGVDYVGGVSGQCYSIANSYNKGNVNGNGYYVGGICGEVYGTFDYNGTITNCYNTGNVSGKNYIGGVCGYNFYNYQTIENCYNIGEVTGTDYVGGVFGGYETEICTIRNCYYLSGTATYGIGKDGADVAGSAEGKTSAQFASGEVCYLLNGSTSTGNTFAWYQNIDNGATDAYPLLDSNGHGKVYQCTPCTGVYSNTENKAGEHLFGENDNGFCHNCGAYQPATLTTDKYDIDDDNSKDNVYEIGNAGQLYWFAGLVNGDASVCDYDADSNPTGTQQNKAACAVLTANIVVNRGLEEGKTLLESLEYDASGNVTNGSNFVAWTPIGFDYENYIGTFDGKGYTISGLYFNDTSKERVGLFGCVDSCGKISNVGVLDSYFQFRMQGGGICGYNSGEINNCTNGGTVIGNSTGSGAGGVCGMNYGTIKDCKNIGAVSGSVSNTGGVCGVIYSGTIENCLNEGAVSGTNDYTGGVCGQANGGAIKWSYNTASVSGLNGVGGVCGYNFNGSLEGCHNTGSVSGTTNSRNSFGGVCGENNSTIKNCYNTGNVSVNNVTSIGGVCGINTGTVTSCFNTGLIGTGSFIGGICGKIGGNSSTTNCYYDSDIYSGDAIGYNPGGTVGEDVMGKTTAQFSSGEVCYLLNGSSPYGEWGQQLGENDYPVLGSAYKVLMAARDGLEGSIYWATFSNLNSNAELIDPKGDITVYNATVSDGTLTLAKRSDNNVFSGEGVLLKANSEYVNAKNISDEVSAAEIGENDLLATPKDAGVINAKTDYTLYRLTYNDVESKEGLGFYLGVVGESKDGSQLKATPGKAYLNVLTENTQLPASTTYARSFAFPRDNGGTTGIGDIVIKGDAGSNGSADGDGSIYDLQGRKVSKPTKGVYIKNNKLFLK